MTAGSTNLDELLLRATEGNQEAVEALLASQRARLKRMVAVRLDRRMVRRVDPSDVVQEVLTKAAHQLPSYLRERPIPFYPWLRRIAWQQLVDLHRQHVTSQKRSVLREQPLDLHEQSTAQLVDHLVANQTSPSVQAVRGELIERVKRAIGTLDETDREVLVLKYLEQLDSSEIAQVMNLSQRAVQVRHRQAIETLHRILNEGPY